MGILSCQTAVGTDVYLGRGTWASAASCSREINRAETIPMAAYNGGVGWYDLRES
jgi:hypothetical protein